VPEFRAVVHVMLRRAILDPQGRAVQATLARLGHDNVDDLRVGKRIELVLRGERADVEVQLEEISASVLSNPVMEDVVVELHEVVHDPDPAAT
jgi:phosphoribosylformylglycinamidine synthase subunit PurS